MQFFSTDLTIDHSSELQQEKNMFSWEYSPLTWDDACQKLDLLWIYLCIQGENNFLLHRHTSTSIFPIW